MFRRHSLHLAAGVLVSMVSGCLCGPGVTRASAELDASPASVDFGVVPVGQATSSMVTLTNHGTRTVTVLSVSIDGANAAAFSTATPTMTTLAPSQTTTVTVLVTPPAAGPYAARLVVRSDADDAEVDVPLSAVAFASQVDGGLPDAGALDAGVDGGLDAGALTCDAGPALDDSALCSAYGWNCGAQVTVDAGCGVQRTVDCGSCPTGATCGSNVCTATSCGTAGVVNSVFRPATSMVLYPRLAWNGSTFAAVWSDTSSLALTFGFLSTSGQLTDAGVATILPTRGRAPRPVWNGTEYGVVYEDINQSGGFGWVDFSRVDAQGQPVSGSQVRLAPFGGSQYRPFSPALAWNPVDQEWGMAWDEQPQTGGGTSIVHFVRLSTQGAVIAGSHLTLGAGSVPDVGPSPLVFANHRYALIHGAAAGMTLSLIDATQPNVVDNLIDPMASARASIALAGGTWGIAYETTSTVMFARADATGALINGSVMQVGVNNSSTPSIATNGSEFVVLMDTFVTNGVFSVDRQRVSVAGVKVGPLDRLACDPAFNAFQDEVWNGFEYAAAYGNQVSVSTWTGNVLIFR